MIESIGRIGKVTHYLTYRTESCGRSCNLSRYDSSSISDEVTWRTGEPSSATSTKARATSTSDSGTITGPSVVRRTTDRERSKSSDCLTRWTESHRSGGNSCRLSSDSSSWHTGRSYRSKARTTSTSDSRSVTRPSIIRRGTNGERSKSSDCLTRWTESWSHCSYRCWLWSSQSTRHTGRSYVRRTGSATSGTYLSVLSSEITLFTISSIHYTISAPSDVIWLTFCMRDIIRSIRIIIGIIVSNFISYGKIIARTNSRVIKNRPIVCKVREYLHARICRH